MLLTKDDFKVGQIVALKHAGNKARYDKGYTLGKVSKCGRKLVTVAIEGFSSYSVQFLLEEKFERDYLLQKTNITGDYELFPSEQAYLEYEEKEDKLDKIKPVVAPMYGKSNLTIDQVRRIYNIINE